MFNSKKQPPIKSLIAQGTRIVGNIEFIEGLRIDGQVSGNLTAVEGSRSILVVSETAEVVGEIRADHVIANGAIVGPVYASELLELQPRARIQGDVYYKSLEMHQGAMITGQLRPVTGDQEKPTLTLAASNA